VLSGDQPLGHAFSYRASIGFSSSSCSTRHGTPIEPRNFNRSFSRCITAAKVPVITVHGTRKTCGSLLAALDVHRRVAMQILRHSKIAVTMEICTEVPSAATREALGKPGQWLDSDS
jgi:integrase